MTLFLLTVGIALSISALCSLLEAMLLSLPMSQVAHLEARKPRIGQIWRRFKENIEKPIAVILILNTTAHTIGAAVAGAQFEKMFGAQWLIVFSLVLTYFMLQFTEILPKTLGVRYSRSLSVVFAAPLNFMITVFSPALTFVHFVNKPFEGKRGEEASHMDEIIALASAARMADSIDSKQERMILAASRFSNLKARQIMTPRTEMATIMLDEPVEEILETLKKSPYTRLPLCDEDIDHVLGVIHLKDLLVQLELSPWEAPGDTPETAERRGEIHLRGTGKVDLRKLCRQVLFFPENMAAQKLLHQFQESRIHIGIVVDEYGSTQGLVTLEDVLEEIVGDIQDEFDEPRDSDVVEVKNGYRIKGVMPLHDFQELLRLPEEILSEADTVGGFCARRLGRIPERGDVIDCDPYEIRVVLADRRRTKEVIVVKKESKDPS